MTERLRDQFRVWAFKVAYKTMAHKDPWNRFADAIGMTNDTVQVPDSTIKSWLKTTRALNELSRETGISHIERVSRQQRILEKHMGVRVKWRAWEIDQMSEMSEPKRMPLCVSSKKTSAPF